MALEITTNNHPRPLTLGDELTAIQRAQFDYLKDDELECHAFVTYKGEVYDLSEFEYIRGGYNNLGFEKWQGIQHDSFFSGIVIRFTDDNEVVVGRYYAKD